jgi:hypothetical protein
LTGVLPDGRLTYALVLDGKSSVFMHAGIAAVAFSVVLACSAASADSLPKTATPMSSDAVEKIYAGNTVISKNFDAYFALDGSIKGLFGKPTVKALIEGSWSVAGNEICMYTFRSREPDSFRDCYQYWQDGRRVVALWSIHSDGSAVDQTNGYHVGEEKSLKAGDLVSDKYAASPPM